MYPDIIHIISTYSRSYRFHHGCPARENRSWPDARTIMNYSKYGKIEIWRFPVRESHQEHEVHRDRPALRGRVQLSTNNARESRATPFRRCPRVPGRVELPGAKSMRIRESRNEMGTSNENPFRLRRSKISRPPTGEKWVWVGRCAHCPCTQTHI